MSDLPGRAAVTETYPVFLSDGRHYVATRGSYASPTQPGVWLSSMDGPESGGSCRMFRMPRSSNRRQAAAWGAVLFTRAGALMALPFDMNRLEAAGEAFPVAQGIAEENSAPTRWPRHPIREYSRAGRRMGASLFMRRSIRELENWSRFR